MRPKTGAMKIASTKSVTQKMTSYDKHSLHCFIEITIRHFNKTIKDSLKISIHAYLDKW